MIDFLRLNGGEIPSFDDEVDETLFKEELNFWGLDILI